MVQVAAVAGRAVRRRAFLAGTSALALARAASAEGTSPPRMISRERFDAGTVRAMARDRASRRFSPRDAAPAAWRDMDYDVYRLAWFDPARAVWGQRDLAFEMDLLLPGLYDWRPVEIDVVRDGIASRLAFDLDLFVNWRTLPPLPDNETLGFSGLRLRHVYPGELWEREFAVFQGASYLRAIGAAQIYGLSARGLALRTGEPEGEEFPEFVRFWVEEPEPGDRSVTLHALLDSPSVAGAYVIRMMPGPACVMEVDCALYPRVDLDHVGIGALTSMFLYDGTNRARFEDFRPAVHDSDGLLVHNGAGEMLWRALANPAALQISSFVDTGPRGFGLMQRARRLSEFADLEARYERRPSLWVEPADDWGPGVVRLVEIPSDREIYDNVVAYWRPQDVIPAGGERRFAYRLIWGDEDAGDAAPPRPDVARVLETYIGRDFERRALQVAIDFGPQAALDRPTEGALSPPEWVPADVTAHVSSAQVAVSGPIVSRNPETGGTRLAFTFDPGDQDFVELRAQLFRDGGRVTEVWLYRWTR